MIVAGRWPARGIRWPGVWFARRLMARRSARATYIAGMTHRDKTTPPPESAGSSSLGASGATGNDPSLTAFKAFFRQHQRDIFGYLWRLTGDEQAAYDLSHSRHLFAVWRDRIGDGPAQRAAARPRHRGQDRRRR